MVILKSGIGPSKKKGKIIANGVSLEEHEIKTVAYFTERGFDVELLKPTYTPKNKNPDIFMMSLTWEIKAPRGKGKSNIEHTIRRAARQSQNVIIDLRRYEGKKPEAAIRELEKHFRLSGHLRRLCIVTPDGKLIFKAKRSALYKK